MIKVILMELIGGHFGVRNSSSINRGSNLDVAALSHMVENLELN